MELTNEEKNFILQAIDTHVRTNGIQVANMALAIVTKLKTPPAKEEE